MSKLTAEIAFEAAQRIYDEWRPEDKLHPAILLTGAELVRLVELLAPPAALVQQPQGEAVGVALVEETCVGPKLFVLGVRVREWLGTTFNDVAHRIAADINAAAQSAPRADQAGDSAGMVADSAGGAEPVYQVWYVDNGGSWCDVVKAKWDAHPYQSRRIMFRAAPAPSASPAVLTDEREAFEAAWRQHYPNHGAGAFKYSEISWGGYANTRVNDGWKMWQARAASPADQGEDARDAKSVLCITATELLDVLELAAPDAFASDFDREHEQMDTEMCIGRLTGSLDDDGKDTGPGLFAWYSEYPEEGVIPLRLDSTTRAAIDAAMSARKEGA